ncbi:zonular occludens toxin domain-containing protein [Planctomyces sp. SH-PL14]|uniref:zonular occludens toxin domain-containing protein n=1 Tax=Planctomyces sp. SH-PL14 TaxID=1632864 RepID=UPI00078B8DC2|nr:zonular occludens toxin domain-containing protein [Planctomyces sp. SH-PL14]AMV21770.1 Zonular occludens toxin (Zot) [Planctomyces sp. SH-PL14]
MAWRPIMTTTIGVAGSGKTYSRVCYLVDKFLPHEAGKLYTNLPLKPAAIAEYCRKTFGSDPAEILNRIYLIPPEVLKKWEQEQEGPWDYFPHPIAGHIIIDEAHRFVSSQHEKEWARKWQVWIGELRHLHGSIEFMTQAENKLPREFKEECERKIVIETDESRRDSWFNIEWHYWYQLWAKLRGRYVPMTIATEMKNVGSKKFETTLETAYVRRPEIFALYDSFSNPNLGGEALGRPKMEYERMTWPRFLLWFFLQNPKQIMWRFGVVTFTVWMIFGGWQWIFTSFMAALSPSEKKPAAAVAKAPLMKPFDPSRGQGKPKDPEPTPAPGYEEFLDARRAATAMQQARSAVRNSRAVPDQAKGPVIDELEAALQQYEEAYKRSSEVVGMVGEEIILRDGSRFKKGETIPDGLLKGRSVTSFDRKTQLFVLDNGEHLKLGGLPKSATENLATAAKPKRVPVKTRVVSEALSGVADTGPQVDRNGPAGAGGPGVPGPSVPVPLGVDRRQVGNQPDHGAGAAGAGSGAAPAKSDPPSNPGSGLSPIGS